MQGRSVASLFSGAGFGDFGFSEAGLDVVGLAEIDPRRTEIASLNFPKSLVFTADISESVAEICEQISKRLADNGEDRLFLLSGTPPCQGMSKNGIGTLLRSVATGLRPMVDPRNELYKPFLEAVKQLLPRWIFFENVCRMMNTFAIDKVGDRRLVTEIMEEELRDLGYFGKFVQVQLADYGLPQTRLRTVGIFQHCQNVTPRAVTFLPPPTHSRNGGKGKLPWVNLRTAIGNLPRLDAKNKKRSASDVHPLHRVPIWRDELYTWLAETPEGCSAYENNNCKQCGTENDDEAATCAKCQMILPKPTTMVDGKPNVIKGFPSAYKRMYWDKPASTVTTRSAYACSDHKVHPDQNRTLSTYEVAVVQGIDPHKYKWGPTSSTKRRQQPIAPDTLLRDVIGECVPPLFSKAVGTFLLNFNEMQENESSREQMLMF